jgi:hypothetical protein
MQLSSDVFDLYVTCSCPQVGDCWVGRQEKSCIHQRAFISTFKSDTYNLEVHQPVGDDERERPELMFRISVRYKICVYERAGTALW